MSDMTSITGKDAQIIRGLQVKVWEVTPATLNQFSNVPHNRPIVAAYISGSLEQPKSMNGISAATVMDLIIETNPRPKEPRYNVYHLVYEVSEGQAVTQWGVFRDKCILPHWPPQNSVAEIGLRMLRFAVENFEVFPH